MPRPFETKAAAERMLPSHKVKPMLSYVFQGVRTGGFLRAVLVNDLRGAFERADSINVRYMYAYVDFLYNWAPAECWGSEEAYEEWITSGGQEGRMSNVR